MCRIPVIVWIVVCTLVASVAIAAPAPVDTRPTLGLMRVTKGEGFSPEQIATIEEVLLTALDSSRRFKVIGASDLAALIDVEARRQAAGCTTDDSCLAQIAGALGVDLLATADIGRLGDTTVLTLKLIAVRNATVIARARETITSNNQLVSAADALVAQVVAAAETDPVLGPKMGGVHRPLSRRHIVGWSAFAVGLACLGGATVAGLVSHGDFQELKGNPHPGSQVQSLVNGTNRDALLANIGFATGGALSVTGLTLVVVF